MHNRPPVVEVGVGTGSVDPWRRPDPSHDLPAARLEIYSPPTARSQPGKKTISPFAANGDPHDRPRRKSPFELVGVESATIEESDLDSVVEYAGDLHADLPQCVAGAGALRRNPGTADTGIGEEEPPVEIVPRLVV